MCTSSTLSPSVPLAQQQGVVAGMSDEANYFEDLSQECSKEWSGYH